MTGYISKKMLGAARLPDTPSARAYLEKVLEDDDTQVYKKPWVNLTEEDLAFLFPHGKSVWAQEMVEIVQAKLREKNT